MELNQNTEKLDNYRKRAAELVGKMTLEEVPTYWKKATEKSRYRLFEKLTSLFQEINLELQYTGIKFSINTEYSPEYLKEAASKYAEIWQLDETTFVAGKGHRKSVQQRHYEKLKEYLSNWNSLLHKKNVIHFCTTVFFIYLQNCTLNFFYFLSFILQEITSSYLSNS